MDPRISKMPCHHIDAFTFRSNFFSLREIYSTLVLHSICYTFTRLYARSEYYRHFCMPSKGESISNHIFNMFRFYGIQILLKFIFTAFVKRVEFRKMLQKFKAIKVRSPDVFKAKNFSHLDFKHF